MMPEFPLQLDVTKHKGTGGAPGMPGQLSAAVKVAGQIFFSVWPTKQVKKHTNAVIVGSNSIGSILPSRDGLALPDAASVADAAIRTRSSLCPSQPKTAPPLPVKNFVAILR